MVLFGKNQGHESITGRWVCQFSGSTKYNEKRETFKFFLQYRGLVVTMVLKTGSDRLVQPLVGHGTGPINWPRKKLNWNQISWTNGPTGEPDEPIGSHRIERFNYYYYYYFYGIKSQNDVSTPPRPALPRPAPSVTSLGTTHCHWHGATTGWTSLPQRHPQQNTPTPPS